MNNKETNIIITALTEKITRLESEIKELKAITPENYFVQYRNLYAEHINKALAEEGITLDKPKPGDLVSTAYGIYLISGYWNNDPDSNTYYCTAWLCDFCGNEGVTFKMEIAGIESQVIECEKSSDMRIASDQEQILFDHMLKQRGYSRTGIGQLIKL